jgi:3-phosphoshikimate 1-carboxyvinyltransferase
LILAGFAEGESALSGLLRSDDTYWCADALRRLGVGVDVDGTDARIAGIGRARPVSGAVHVGSAGTAARFLPPFLAAGEAGQWRVTASRQMSRRPVAALFETMRQGGARIHHEGEAGCFPVTIDGGSFVGGDLSISGSVSSQFISGLLMGAAHAERGVRLRVEGGIVQSDYVSITLDAMRQFGVEAQADNAFTEFAVAPGAYRGRSLAVEADASTATYFAALAAVTQGSVTLLNLTPETRQPDYGFMEILERLGCQVERRADRTRITGVGRLRGGFSLDMRPLSDAALTLAAIAPFADAPFGPWRTRQAAKRTTRQRDTTRPRHACRWTLQ